MVTKQVARSWKNIFLDTSVIVDYLSSPDRLVNQPDVQLRINFVKETFDKLFDYSEIENSKLNLYVSAVTVSEIQRRINGRQDLTASEMLNDVFNSADIIFIDYSRKIANDLNKQLQDLIPEIDIKAYLKALGDGLNKLGVHNSRQWIKDDLKILACAKSVPRLDIILTNDERTFVPLAKKMGVPYAIMHPNYWEADLFGQVV